jgi:hypothetical protein
MPMLDSRARQQSLQQALAEEAWWRRPLRVTVASAVGSATATSATALDSASASMPDGPLRLTDDQLAAVLRAAEPLAVGDRGAFRQDVAAALQGQELGDGMVYRAVAQVQRKYYDPPILTPGSRWEC